MKKKLLYLTSIMLFAASSINAQTSKVWEFQTDPTNWPETYAVPTGGNLVTDNLGLFAGSSVIGFGDIVSSGGTGVTFSDNFTSNTVLRFLGGGYSTNIGTGYYDPNNYFLPEQRFLYFAVTGPCTVKVWFRTAQIGSNRAAIITDGISFKTYAGTTASSPTQILTANYTGGAGKLYIFSDNAINIDKIEVIASGATGLGTTTTLGTNDFQKESPVVVSATNGKISLSNVTYTTKVSVYSVLGSLVKSIETNEDTSIAINSGVYIVKAQSAEGSKSVKVIVP